MTSIKVELNPFIVPNYVSVKSKPRPKQEGLKELPAYTLDELDEQTLSELCDEFRHQVFLKAGKEDPRNLGQGVVK